MQTLAEELVMRSLALGREPADMLELVGHLRRAWAACRRDAGPHLVGCARGGVVVGVQ